MSLTTLIHTKNSAEILKAALESVASFSDEIIVIDMESTDETRTIAKKYTSQVFSHPDVGYVEPARNFGIAKVTSDWVFILDADEEVSKELAGFITQVTKNQSPTELLADAYAFPRKNIIFDKWIEHTGWWPDHQLRLFKKGSVKWKNQIHSEPVVTGKLLTLPAETAYAIIHHNYQTISQYLDRLNRYTQITAQQEAGTAKTLTSHTVVDTFSNEFFRRFFAEQGIKDGVHGLSLSLLQACYQLVVQLKVWERQGFPARTEPAASLTALRAWQQELAYWLADSQVHRTNGLENIFWRIRRKLKI